MTLFVWSWCSHLNCTSNHFKCSWWTPRATTGTITLAFSNKKCQMPSVIEALHWLLLAENKPNSGEETLWSFSSLKISNTSCALFFHNFFSELYNSKFTPTVQDLAYLYRCQKNWAASKGSSKLMSCNWNSPMETGAAGNLVCSRTKEGVQSHSLQYHLAPWPHSYCQLQCGERLSNASLQNLLFKGCLRGLSRVCPHVWPQGPIEITSASLSRQQALMALSACYQQVQVEQVWGTEGRVELCAVMNNNLWLLEGTLKNILKIRLVKAGTGFPLKNNSNSHVYMYSLKGQVNS